MDVDSIACRRNDVSKDDGISDLLKDIPWLRYFKKYPDELPLIIQKASKASGGEASNILRLVADEVKKIETTLLEQMTVRIKEEIKEKNLRDLLTSVEEISASVCRYGRNDFDFDDDVSLAKEDKKANVEAVKADIMVPMKRENDHTNVIRKVNGNVMNEKEDISVTWKREGGRAIDDDDATTEEEGITVTWRREQGHTGGYRNTKEMDETLSTAFEKAATDGKKAEEGQKKQDIVATKSIKGCNAKAKKVKFSDVIESTIPTQVRDGHKKSDENVNIMSTSTSQVKVGQMKTNRNRKVLSSVGNFSPDLEKSKSNTAF